MNIANQEQTEYAAIIPEAFLVVQNSSVDDSKERVAAAVEQQPIIVSGYAEPLLPWWKQTRTRVLLGLFILCVTVMAIILGVRKPQTIIIDATSAPSISLVPSVSPSDIPSYAPSISSAPSPLPTTLLYRLSNSQEVALNGTNMVVVTQELSLIIVFYVLTTDNGVLKPVSAFAEDDYGEEFTVYMNGNVTTLDFPTACGGRGGQLVYVFDNGLWVQEQDSRCPPPWGMAPPEAGGAYYDGEEGTSDPVEEVSESTSSATLIVISILVPVLFCSVGIGLGIYCCKRRRSNKDQAEKESKAGIADSITTERLLALRCPCCSEVTSDNYAMVPCGHILCAKCSDEYITHPCPTCHGRLEGRLKVTCKTTVA